MQQKSIQSHISAGVVVVVVASPPAGCHMNTHFSFQNCMLAVNSQQLWIGSQDSLIYIINPRSTSCNKHLTEHRVAVTGFALEERADKFR